MKGSALVETMIPSALLLRSALRLDAGSGPRQLGRPHRVAAYLGKTRIRPGIVDFSQRYADQNERDYEAFVAAVKSGRLAATEGV